MHSELVSVGIFFEEGMSDLFNLLDSLRAEKDFVFDILIAGSFSSEQEHEILGLYPTVRIFNLRIFSKPVCRQILLDNSRSEYILFLSSACRLKENAVSNLFIELENAPLAGLIYGKINYPENEDASSLDCCLARRSALTILGGFPVDLSPLAFHEQGIVSAKLKALGYDELTSRQNVATISAIKKADSKNMQTLAWRRYDAEYFQRQIQSLQAENILREQFRAAQKKISILLLHDREGWAWWHRSHNIKKHIAPDFEIDIKKCNEPYIEGQYDFIVWFDAHFYDRVVQSVKNSEKLILGCSNDKLIESTRHACSLLPHVGVVANSYTAYSELRNDLNVFCCQNGVDGDVFYPSTEIPAIFSACWVGNPKHLGNKGLDIIELACKAVGVPLIVSNRELGDNYSHEELRDHVYHRANVYLCASEAEGTPNPALEAMACGLPVISTPVGNMVEMIVNGYNGFLVEREVRALAQALKKMRQMSQEDLRANARHTIENGWLWRQQVKKYEHMFLQLMTRKFKDWDQESDIGELG
jgi:glycosyltransferase involved in cell wall biosynthesis